MPKVSDSYHQARRDQILAAAEACFARKGMRETTMQDIASEAGVSYGVLYNYFPSKHELFRGAWEAAQASREARFREAAKLGNSVTVLETVLTLGLDRWRDAASTDELRMRLQVLAEAVHDESFHSILQDGLEMYWERFIEIVRRGQADGEIDASLDPRAVAYLLFALQEGVSEQKAIVPDVDIDGYKRLMVLVLERTLRPRKGGEASNEGNDATK